MQVTDAGSPDISVIIPAYNAEDTISAALRSAQEQSFGNLEIIVIDDASTDGTAAMIGAAARQDCRVRRVRMAVNAGPAASRNRGLALARGRWIALLDADDSFDSRRLENLISLADEAGVDVVSDNVALWRDGADSGMRIIPPSALVRPRVLSFREFIDGAVIGSTASQRMNYVFLHPMFRREFLRENGIRYNELNRNGEDLLFYVACFLAGARWMLEPKPMYRYTVREGSLTEHVSMDDARRIITVLKGVLRDPRVSGDSLLASSIRRHVRSMAVACYYWRFKSAVTGADWAALRRVLLADRVAAPLIAYELLSRGPGYCWRIVASRARRA